MQAYPHHYPVNATAQYEGAIYLNSPGLASIESAPPAEFGGPGDRWSPETLLVAAVADCYILTFRAIARASKLNWKTLDCEVDGVLEQMEHGTCFTRFNLNVRLELPEEIDKNKAQRLLEKAELRCLITNSMNSEIHLETKISHSNQQN